MKVKEIGKRYVTVYCLCGDSMSGWVSPPGVKDPVKEAWLSAHRGEGHGPASREQVQKARRSVTEGTERGEERG